MNAEVYNEKVHELLDQEPSCSELKKVPTKATERKLLLVLKDLHKEKKISDVFLRPYTTIGRLQSASTFLWKGKGTQGKGTT